MIRKSTFGLFVFLTLLISGCGCSDMDSLVVSEPHDQKIENILRVEIGENGYEYLFIIQQDNNVSVKKIKRWKGLVGSGEVKIENDIPEENKGWAIIRERNLKGEGIICTSIVIHIHTDNIKNLN